MAFQSFEEPLKFYNYVVDQVDKYRNFYDCYSLRIKCRDECVKLRCRDTGHEFAIKKAIGLFSNCKVIIDELYVYINTNIKTTSKRIKNLTNQKIRIMLESSTDEIFLKIKKLNEQMAEMKNISDTSKDSNERKRASIENKILFDKRKILIDKMSKDISKYESKELDNQLDYLNKSLNFYTNLKNKFIQIIAIESPFGVSDSEKYIVISNIDNFFEKKYFSPEHWTNEQLFMNIVFSDNDKIEKYILPLYSKTTQNKAVNNRFKSQFGYLLYTNVNKFTLQDLYRVFDKLHKNDEVIRNAYKLLK